jgi:hypothetical protein
VMIAISRILDSMNTDIGSNSSVCYIPATTAY